MFRSIILCSFIFVTGCDLVTDNNPVNQLNSIKPISIYTSSEDLQQLYNERLTDVSFASDIEVDGVKLVGRIEASGRGSRFRPKISMSVTPTDRTIYELSEFNLSAQVADDLLVRTAIAKYLYQSAGFPVFFSENVFVKMNDENWGLYVLTEELEELEYFAKNNLPVYELFGIGFGTVFTLVNNNEITSHIDKEIPDDINYNSLLEFVHALDVVETEKIFSELGKYLDIENYLLYHAVSSVRNDPDSFNNNFYLYREYPGSPFKVIPWDFDKTLFYDNKIGLFGSNLIINKLMQNDSCVTLYKNYVQEILNNSFREDKLFPIIDSVYTITKEYFQYDPYLKNLDHKSEVERLKSFITERRIFLYNELASMN